MMSQLRELALPACAAAPVAEFVVMSLAPQLDALSTTIEVRSSTAQSHTSPEALRLAFPRPRVVMMIVCLHEGPFFETFPNVTVWRSTARSAA